MSHSNHSSKPFASRPVGESADRDGVNESPFHVETDGSEGDSMMPSDRAKLRPTKGSQPASSASPFELVEGNRSEIEGGVGPGFPMHGFPSGPAALAPLEMVPSRSPGEPSFGGENTASDDSGDPFGEMIPQQENTASAMNQAVPISPVGSKGQADFAIPAGSSQSAAGANAGVTLPGQRDEQPAPLSDRTRQLELRAIFGVDHELSHLEIMERMRDLPGIINVAEIKPSEVDAFGSLKSCASKLGLGNEDAVIVNCPRGVIDFVQYQGTALGILMEGRYGPGVRETIYICTRELERLK
ncbi:MAG: hypothetical protein ABGZ31_05320 [Roseibacillus sp.]